MKWLEWINPDQPWLEIAELSFKLFCAYAISFNANKFITAVLVYEMNIYWNVNTEAASLVISLTLIAYTHKMLKT